jgi:uncharacterized protein (TIGR03067 family)
MKMASQGVKTMRLTALLLFLGASLLLAAGPASQEAGEGDAARLQGNWSIVLVEIDGQALAMDNLKGASLRIQGTRYSFQLQKTRLELSFKLDASKSPKTIELEVVEGPEKGKVYHGIYKLEKDRYTICRTTEAGKERPTKFATQAKSGLMIVVWDKVAVP